MSKGLSDKKKEAQSNFASMFDDSEGDAKGGKPTPEAVVVAVLHGKGNNEITDRQLDAAKMLLPYRLPKLNTIDAHVATTEMSHEDWISSIDDEEDDDDE